MNPIISIIVPVYNAEQFIGRCIESVLSQTFCDFELILINDGSNDNSLSICQKYADLDSRVKVIDKPNGGVSSARNVGILAASGNWLSFLDADDYLSSTFLSDFDTKRISDVELYAQGCISEYADRPSEEIRHLISGRCAIGSFMESMLHTGQLATPWGKLFSADIIRTNNLCFNEKLSYAEDRLFNVQFISYCRNFSLSTGIGYHYTHENPNALTRRYCPEEMILTYVRQYRPLLLNIVSRVNLTPKLVSEARSSYNYHILQAIIQKMSSQITVVKKIEFLHSIEKEMIMDAATQEDLPTFYYVVSRILRFPISIAVLMLSLLTYFKR